MLFISGHTAGGGYVDGKNRIVVSSISTARRDIAGIRNICEYWELNHTNRTLHSINRGEIQAMLQHFCLTQASSGDISPEIKGFGLIKIIGELVDRSNKNFHAGKLFDGFSHRITEGFRKSALAELIEARGLSYAEWKKGGSYGSIPLTCASLMLAEAITLIESDDAKAAVIFFNTWKKYKSKPGLWFGAYDRLTAYRKFQAHPNLAKTFPQWESSIMEIGQSLDEVLERKLDAMPWKSFTELTEFCTELLKAALTILLLLSGFRLSELQSMLFDSFEIAADGTWWFKTENYKTDHGFATPICLHGLAADAANLLKGLTPLNVDQYQLPVFHHAYRDGAISAAMGWNRPKKKDWSLEEPYKIGTLRKYFKVFYTEHVVDKYLGVKEVHPEVTPHQTRHTFAEFALRRFDGKVSEKLREHFRHAPGSSHTRKYTEAKVSESVKLSLENEYLAETIGRIAAGHIDDTFFGPAAKRIEMEIRKISIVSPEEFDQAIKKLASKYSRFIGFEWGFCALRTNEEHLAKCHDRETGIPSPDRQSSPEVCTSCPHSMNNDYQANSLKRTAWGHAEIAKSHPLKAIGQLSFEIVKQVKKRLKLMEGLQ